jgi:GNAT superfamily N-acetyltransferase
MEIRPITAAQSRTVRHPILRAGLPPEAAILDHDDDPGTLHLGAFDGTRLVSVATFFAQACPLDDHAPAWRLRGMATFEDARRRGAGTELVAEGIRVAKTSGARLVWCNARAGARSFYEKLGFAVVGDRFELPVGGPHYVMIKNQENPS